MKQTLPAVALMGSATLLFTGLLGVVACLWLGRGHWAYPSILLAGCGALAALVSLCTLHGRE